MSTELLSEYQSKEHKEATSKQVRRPAQGTQKGKPAKKYKVVKEACVLRKGSAGDMNVPEEMVVDPNADFCN